MTWNLGDSSEHWVNDRVRGGTGCVKIGLGGLLLWSSIYMIYFIQIRERSLFIAELSWALLQLAACFAASLAALSASSFGLRLA